MISNSKVFISGEDMLIATAKSIVVAPYLDEYSELDFSDEHQHYKLSIPMVQAVSEDSYQFYRSYIIPYIIVETELYGKPCIFSHCRILESHPPEYNKDKPNYDGLLDLFLVLESRKFRSCEEVAYVRN